MWQRHADTLQRDDQSVGVQGRDEPSLAGFALVLFSYAVLSRTRWMRISWEPSRASQLETGCATSTRKTAL